MQTHSLDGKINTFIQSMPKAELHIHLEGSMRPETLLTLAERHNRTHMLPATDLAALRQWFTFTDFSHFVEIYLIISDLLRTPEDFALLVEACGADMAAQQIRYRELTVTPYTHTHLQEKGLTIEDLLSGLEAGRAKAKADHGVEMRWIFDIPRNASFRHNNGTYDPTIAEKTLAYAIAGQTKGVIGFGLGGFEVGAPPEPFAHIFAEAKAAGLLSVPHAGETMGAASVWGAVRALGADRIGHGVRAIEDPALLQLLKEEQIVLEICPTSNVCLHVYRQLACHPFPHLDRMGLVVTINSDDPPLFNTSLCQEYLALVHQFGYDRSDLIRVARHAFIAAGAPPALKRELLTEFDQWVAART